MHKQFTFAVNFRTFDSISLRVFEKWKGNVFSSSGSE